MNGWALLGIIAIYLLICVAIGLLRGLSRSRIRTISILFSGILAFIITLIVKGSLGSVKEIEQGLRDSGVLNAEMMNTVSSMLGMSASLGEALLGIISALIMPLVFLVLFMGISILTWIVYMIIWLVMRKKLREHNERAHMKILRTVLLSVAHGLIVAFVVLVPINVYTQMLPPVMEAAEQAEVLEDYPEVSAVVNDYITPISDSGVMATFRVLAGGPVCNAMTNFKVNDTTVSLVDEVGGISKFACNILALGKTPLADYGENQASFIDTIADCVSDSALLSGIVGDVIYCSTDAWIGGEKFVGIERPNVGEMIDPSFGTLLTVLHKDSKNLPQLKADIHTVADMVIVLTDYDVFSKMEDTDNLIQQLGADGMVKELITVLGENSSMKVLIVEIRNMGMRAIAQSLDIPANGEVVYEQFLGDIATALNETQGMGETERLDALTEKVKTAFNEANVPIEEDIIDCYSASLIYDLGSIENITADDISDFFTVYANATESGEAPALEPISHKKEQGFRGDVYGSMSEEKLASSGATVLANVTVQLSQVEGDEQTIASASSAILKESYAGIFEEDHPAMNKINQIEMKTALDRSAVDNTASMKGADTMNSGVVTLDRLLADVHAVAENINPETLVQEAEALDAVFKDMSKLISPDASLDSIDDIIGTLGPVLDSLQSSVSVGENGTADLLVATLQSKTVREKANLDMNSATNLAKKATESSNGEKVDYEKTLNSVAGVVVIGNSISSGDIASEEDIRKMIENLTPQTAAVLREFVTEERMKEYGMPADNAHTSSELLLNLFDYLASDLPEDQFDHEALALQQLINIATAAKEDVDATRIFGKDGKLGKEAYDIIKIVIESDAICHSLEKTLVSESGIQSDPFGVGKQIPQDSIDMQEFNAAADAYYNMNSSEETAHRLVLVRALFGI